MPSKVDSTSHYEAEERFPLLREIAGILLGLVALLVLLALIAFHNGATWVGQRGYQAAEWMVLCFGMYVVYVLPALLLLSAVYLFSAADGAGGGGARWLRGIGGVLNHCRGGHAADAAAVGTERNTQERAT